MRSEQTAKRVLGGAGLAAVIGGIAGNAGMGTAIGAVARTTAALVQKGQKVSVFGTKLDTGELVAREILIGAADSHAAHK